MESQDNNIQDNINRDTFSESIRKKMENHAMPVDAAVWKSVRKTLPARSKRLPVWLVYSLSAAASLALVLTVGFQFFINQDRSAEVITAKVQTNEVKTQQQSLPEAIQSTEKTKIISSGLKNRITAVPLSVVKTQTEDAGKPENTHDVVVDEKAVQNQIIITEDQPEQTLAVQTNEPVSNDQQKQILIDEPTLSKALEEKSRDWTENLRLYKVKPVQLAAGFGSGTGGASASFLGNSMDFMAAELTQVKVKAANIMKPEDFRNRDYLPPVTIGARISYSLNNNWTVETGLSYTWLMTRLNESYWGNYQASLSLHYLGIPLNLRYTLMKSGKWNFYGSAGVMLEKGIWSDYKQFQDWGTAEYRTEASQKIDGVQWSTQASVGVEYQINKLMNWYFEPGINYFFQNEQPFSIRTEMPLGFVLNAGLRFKI